MKKIIRETDEKNEIVQVTIADERWYVKEVTNPATELPEFRYVPSVTWIAGHYPKGVEFYKWLAEHGWDEAEQIKREAGTKGDRVHQAISAILEGQEVRIDTEFLNKETGQMEELTLDECDAIKSFIDWRNETEKDYIVEFLFWDVTIFSEKYGYGGSIDAGARITPKPEGKNPLKLSGPTVYLIDFKTSQSIWASYELQLSAYREPLTTGEFFIEGFKDTAGIQLAILQVGYRKNKAGFRWVPIENKFYLFLAARQIWAHENEGVQPKKKDYPIVLSPGITVAEVMEANEPEALPVPEVEEPVAATPGKRGKK